MKLVNFLRRDEALNALERHVICCLLSTLSGKHVKRAMLICEVNNKYERSFGDKFLTTRREKILWKLVSKISLDVKFKYLLLFVD